MPIMNLRLSKHQAIIKGSVIDIKEYAVQSKCGRMLVYALTKKTHITHQTADVKFHTFKNR